MLLSNIDDAKQWCDQRDRELFQVDFGEMLSEVQESCTHGFACGKPCVDVGVDVVASLM